jgi:hypothetical protein
MRRRDKECGVACCPPSHGKGQLPCLLSFHRPSNTETRAKAKLRPERKLTKAERLRVQRAFALVGRQLHMPVSFEH